MATAGVSAGEDCMLLTRDTLAFAARDTGRTTDVTVASAAADKPYEMMEAAQSGTANATLGTITDDDATSTAMSPPDAELGVDFRGARRRYGDSGPDHLSSEAVTVTATAMAAGRWMLVVHEGDLEGWGASGSARLLAGARGVSFALGRFGERGVRASPGWTGCSPTVAHVAGAAPRGSRTPVCRSSLGSARTSAPTVSPGATGAAPTKSRKLSIPPPAQRVGHSRRRSLRDRKVSEPSDAISARPSGHLVRHRPSPTEQMPLPGDGVPEMCR